MSNDNEETTSSHISPFEAIRRVNEEGIEYWTARDLARVLGYATNYRNFKNAISKAEIACVNSGQTVTDHFAHVRNMIEVGKGAKREVEDVQISRYGCYLVIQNADPTKEIVALGQTYFAVQTRRQERADELATLSEDQRRLYLRSQLSDHNRQLAETASEAGVVRSIDFAIFQDHGYMGLYGGLKAKDIHTRKGLKKNQQIADHMGSDELIANLFRASQTRQKLEREQVKGKEQANRTHYEVGQRVRQTIKDLGGTLPENLPSPKESIQQLEQKERKRLKQGLQPSMFDDPTEPEN